MASLINIRSAMQEWQNSICITFKERSFEEDYIEFAYEGGYGIDKLNLSLFTGAPNENIVQNHLNNSIVKRILVSKR